MGGHLRAGCLRWKRAHPSHVPMTVDRITARAPQPTLNSSRPIGPEAWRHLYCPPQGRSGEGRTVIVRGCGARRSTHHDRTASRQSPVIHARGRAGVRISPAAGWHGFADVSCPIVAPGPDRRQPALACALGGQIRDGHRIRSAWRAGITPFQFRVAASISPFGAASCIKRRTTAR